ncbi:DUF2705 family protein [Priestia aryabhattai]|uniref:DUF2705 family protein n=1 Tax=Priestia aryabhattai TaxID=412384 RepID=UPI001ADB759E|nr:DUF2705 family protein [Priestia aryabhattai]QTL52612.1 DUF2705 family protein [Priestia aryabhattai]
MKSNILRAYKDKKSMSIFWLIILMPCIDLILVKTQWSPDLNPNLSFVLVGMSEGHIPQILLFWFLPIYTLVLCTDSYIQDVKTGMNNLIISRKGKRAYFLNKLYSSFLIPFVVMFVALLINLILAFIINAGETGSSGLLEMNNSENKLFTFSQHYPLLINIIFLINVSFFTGLAGLLGLSISIMFPDRKYTYPLSFFIWFILVALPNHTVTMVMQPFTEYDYDYIGSSWVVNFLILFIITIVAYFYKEKTDEL